MKEIKMWAWVYTDPKLQHQPIISIDESKEIVAAEKREWLQGKTPEQGKIMRSIYRQSKVVPVVVIVPLDHSELDQDKKYTMGEYNIIDGEKCCWRCGASQKDVREGKAGGCSGWGTYYGNHMYKATKVATLDHLPDRPLNQERD